MLPFVVPSLPHPALAAGICGASGARCGVHVSARDTTGPENSTQRACMRRFLRCRILVLFAVRSNLLAQGGTLLSQFLDLFCDHFLAARVDHSGPQKGGQIGGQFLGPGQMASTVVNVCPSDLTLRT